MDAITGGILLCNERTDKTELQTMKWTAKKNTIAFCLFYTDNYH